MLVLNLLITLFKHVSVFPAVVLEEVREAKGEITLLTYRKLPDLPPITSLCSSVYRSHKNIAETPSSLDPRTGSFLVKVT